MENAKNEKKSALHIKGENTSYAREKLMQDIFLIVYCLDELEKENH